MTSARLRRAIEQELVRLHAAGRGELVRAFLALDHGGDFARLERYLEGCRALARQARETAGKDVFVAGSIGLDLQQWVDKGLLRFMANRPSLFGLETHLASMHREVEEFAPAAVVVDPISSLIGSGTGGDVHAMILRLQALVLPVKVLVLGGH